MISLSFLGLNPNIDIQSLIIPDFSKLNFSNLLIIIISITTLVLMVLGLLFSSIESSAKVNKLLHFLKNGMPDSDLLKLDRVSQSIAEYIKGLGSESINTTHNEEEEKDNTTSNEEKDEDLPFEKEEDVQEFEEFQPNLPSPDEFDGEDKKTIVASSFSLEGLGSLKSKDESERFAPSNFSDFSDEEDSSKGVETVIASVPEELLMQTQNTMDNNYEKELISVYKKFYEMKVELGESTSSLTEEAFVKKLKDTEKKLINTNNCKKVEFMVYNKEGKAALKATPKY
jgi:hypothetical protein